ncbi:24853_t:CDS:2 [Gigaspora margarita]|uniref:24853_t:CDS:1 n=1 Tax=Gigaspora margarita TaxID=4874 RepID=A0ABN7V720_GIGMA|nr:24853_t:CDS:2 [Gigaspora margarita]
MVIPSLGPAKYCYAMTLREINQRQKLIKQYSLATPQLSWLEIIATRKIIGYILTYLIQWTPVVIYVAGLMVNYDQIWTNIIAVATINFGGVANMIAYIVNEKWRDDYKSNLSASYLNSSKLNTTSKPSTNNDKSLPSQISVEEVITIVINQDPVFSSPEEKFFGRVL